MFNETKLLLKLFFCLFRSTTQLKQLSSTLQSNLNTLNSVKPGGKSGHGAGFPHFSKDLSGCSGSWRAVAIFFIVLTIAMASTLAFVIASSLVSPSQTEIAKACAVVDSGGVVQHEQVTQGVSHTTSHQGPGNHLIYLISNLIYLPLQLNKTLRTFLPCNSEFFQKLCHNYFRQKYLKSI